jgi:hypothetical protein
MSSKAKEALEKIRSCADYIYSYPNNIGGVQQCARDIMETIDKIASEPLRNCEVGTAEGQSVRHYEWCRKHGIDGDKEVACAHPDMTCSLCVLRWAQMPYEEGEEK